jgi:hypothetical protein
MAQIPIPRTFAATGDADDELVFDDYALAVGKASHAWNYFQDKLGSLFAVVSGSDRQVALAIWHSSGSEQAQRKMLKAAIVARDPEDWPQGAAAREDIRWLLKVADELADARRDAIHACATLFAFHPDDGGARFGPALRSGHRRSQDPNGESLLRDIQWGSEAAKALSRFTMEIEAALAFAGGCAWPTRPPLPIRGEIANSDLK